ncbi:MAG: hypothetical protein ABSE90_11090 [Verrucomicrobiota bacterium]
MSRAADEIMPSRLAVLQELHQFEKIYVEIFPGVLNKPASQIPIWAGDGAPASNRATAAIAAIDELLQ